MAKPKKKCIKTSKHRHTNAAHSKARKISAELAQRIRDVHLNFVVTTDDHICDTCRIEVNKRWNMLQVVKKGVQVAQQSIIEKKRSKRDNQPSTSGTTPGSTAAIQPSATIPPAPPTPAPPTILGAHAAATTPSVAAPSSATNISGLTNSPGATPVVQSAQTTAPSAPPAQSLYPQLPQASANAQRGGTSGTSISSNVATSVAGSSSSPGLATLDSTPTSPIPGHSTFVGGSPVAASSKGIIGKILLAVCSRLD